MSMKQQKPRLGRGLSSLISIDISEADIAAREESAAALPVLSTPSTPSRMDTPVIANAPTSSVSLRDLPVSTIDPNPHQPRRQWEPAAMAALTESVKKNGLLQPILVRPVADRFELIAGERRLRAAKEAGLAEIPAIVKETDNVSQATLALIENIHRDDLHALDRAAAYKTLMDQANISQLELSDRLHEERSSIANYLRLLDLAAPVQQLFRDGKLSLGHCKLLAGVSDILLQTELANRAVVQGVSVRQLELAIEEGMAAGQGPAPAPPAPEPKPAASAHIAELEKNLSGQLGMRINIKNGHHGKGRLTIHYGSLDQFDELVNRLGLKVES